MQELIDGLVQGSVFALAAAGLVLIFSVVGVPHFAHGESVMLGGMVTAALVTSYHVPVIVAMLGGTAAGTALGLLLSQVLYWPLRNHPEVNILAASLAVVLIVETAAVQIWTASVRVTPTGLQGYIHVLGARVPSIWLILVAVAFVFVCGTYLYVHLSRAGRAMRAMAMNRTAALLAGIPVRRYELLAFGIGSALAGAGGALYSTAFGVQATMGSGITLDAFIVIIFAGVGSIFGAFWVGLLLGVVQSFTGTYISAGYQDMFGYIFMLVVLIARPEGLFGFATARQ